MLLNEKVSTNPVLVVSRLRGLVVLGYRIIRVETRGAASHLKN